MIVRKIVHEHNITLVIDIPFEMAPQCKAIRKWLSTQSEHATLLSPCSPELPGFLYFYNEEFASAFILRWG